MASVMRFNMTNRYVAGSDSHRAGVHGPVVRGGFQAANSGPAPSTQPFVPEGEKQFNLYYATIIPGANLDAVVHRRHLAL